MNSRDKASPLRILRPGETCDPEPIAHSLDASVLAKLAADVIAWNRVLSPSELLDSPRPTRVADLTSMKCGLKILKKEESADQPGELRRLFKE